MLSRIVCTLAVAAALGLAGASAPAQAAGQGPCAGPAAPAVQVVPRLGNPKFNSTPREQLTLAAIITRPGEADGMLDFRAGADITLEPSPARGNCPVRSVQAVIQPTLLELYIAKEVEPGSCRFRAVYEHELKHVMVAQKVIDSSAASLRKKLVQVIASLTADQARDLDSVRAALNETVREQLDELNEAYAVANESIDTAEEGQRMADKCAEPQAFVGDRLLSGESRAPAPRSSQR